MYALVPVADGALAPSEVEWGGNIPAKGSAITLLQTKQKLKWKTENSKVIVQLPKSVKTAALALSFTPAS